LDAVVMEYAKTIWSCGVVFFVFICLCWRQTSGLNGLGRNKIMMHKYFYIVCLTYQKIIGVFNW